MSITNFINEQDVTIIQGVNGIRLCEESWITRRTQTRDKTEKETQNTGTDAGNKTNRRNNE